MRYGFLLRAVDLIAVTGSVTLVWNRHFSGLLFGESPLALIAILATAAFLLLVFTRIGMYQRSFATTPRDEVYGALAAFGLVALPAAILIVALPQFHGYRQNLLGMLAIMGGTLSLGRYVAHAIRQRIAPPPSRKIVVAGTGDRVAAVPSELALSAGDSVQRFAIDGFDEEFSNAADAEELAQLEWLHYAIENRCTEIIVTEALPPDVLPTLLRITEANGIRLAFAPTRIRPHARDFTIRRDGGLALMYPRSLAVCRPGANLFKRTFDIAFCSVALAFLAIPLGLVALAVLIDSGRPIFYRQTRVGRMGKTFEIIKFRTMAVDAEAATGPVWARAGEARITRIGKFLRRFSLDELPQLLNVMRGDMSLVGPRPERPFYVEQFRKMLKRYEERSFVRPGLTGWAQIYMRRELEPSQIGEKLSYDLFYLEHWSVYMDLLIVCKTAAEFLFHSAA